MVDPSHTFHVADYVVFGATIVISIAIGIYYALSGGRQRTTSEYLVGERKMQFLPVAISLMVSFESSIMMLGLPAEAYVYGIQWWWSCVGFLASQLLSIIIMVPLLHPLQITSAYEYLQYRFNSTAVRLLGTVLGMLTYAWYMGIVLFGPAIALEAVTGFPQWGSIFIIAFVAVIYTAIGGLKAVIWTDVFQAFVMYAGMLAVLIKGTLDVGGPSQVWNIAQKGGRLNFFNFDVDPTVRHTFWSLFFGSLIRGFGLAFNQSTVQRVSSCKSQREARWVLVIVAPCFFISLTMACYEGIVAYAYYQTKGCDPLASDKITNSNQIIPFTVMDIFMGLPGMPGLFLASLFSASLSTLSSGLSSLSALMWADVVQPRIGQVSEMKATIIAKVSVVVFGLLGCGIALLVSLIGGPMTQISGSLLAAFAGPLTGLFLLGCFSPMANAKGAFIGGTVALLFSSWLSLGQNFSPSIKKTPWLPAASTDNCYNSTDVMISLSNITAVSDAYVVSTSGLPATADDGPQGIDKMYTLSYQWLAPVGIFTVLIVGSVVSFITGGNKEGGVDPRYLIGFFDHLCCFLPECIRKRLRYDDYTTASYDDYVPPLKGSYLDTELVIVTEPGSKTAAEKGPLLDKANDHAENNVLPNGVTTSDVSDVTTTDVKENGIQESYITGNLSDVRENGVTQNDVRANDTERDDVTGNDNKENDVQKNASRVNEAEENSDTGIGEGFTEKDTEGNNATETNVSEK